MSSSNSPSLMGSNTSITAEIDGDEEETIADSFVCCICLDLLYKPVVLGCGHVSCFWCVHKSMNGLHESQCPICRNPYHHFPTICEMLHFLLLKMYPVAYKRREKQVFEEETQMGFFSPQIDAKGLNIVAEGSTSEVANIVPNTSSACDIGEGKDFFKMSRNGSATVENDAPAMNYDGTSSKVSITDVLCRACNQILFLPVVLNCGHVYCEACITVPEDGIIICKVCENPHPTDFPNICLELNNFLNERFPEVLTVRGKNVEQKQAQFQRSGPNKSAKKGFLRSFPNGEDFLPWWDEHGSKVHMGAGCDYCGMLPIVGDRYRCLDCVEQIGFDLCGDCYNTRSKRPGRFNQQHTSDHQFELVKQPDALRNIMLQLVDGNPVDSSGTSVLAVSASDGWIAVESGEDVQIASDDAVAPDDSRNDNHVQYMFTPMEYSNPPDISDNDSWVSAQGDIDSKQDEDDQSAT